MEKDKSFSQQTSENDEYGGFSSVQVFLAHILSGGTLAELEGRSPEALDAMYYVAVKLYNSKRYKEAHPVFHELVRLNHLEPRFMYGLAACLHKMERYINAANIYFSSILLNPEADNIEAHFYIADCLISANQSPGEAKKYLQYVVDSCPKEGPLAPLRSVAEAKLKLFCKNSEEKKKDS